MLLAEEFLLLSLDDDTGRMQVGGDKLDPGLRGALIAELALRERVGITADSEGWNRRRRLTITDLKPTDDAELDRALDYLAEREGKRIKDLVSSMGHWSFSKGLRDRLLERLAAAGVLSEQQGTVLGIFPRRTWPVRDRGPEEEVRGRLHSTLVAGLTPTEATVSLIGLLHATDRVRKVVPSADPKAVKARAKALAEGDWVAKAVADAIQEAAAAAAGAAAS